jgi:predicted O-methyltransferase YrrM
MNQVSAAPDILSNISSLSSSMWAYTSLSAAFELGLAKELGDPATATELSARVGVEPELVRDLLGVLVALGAVETDGPPGDERYVSTPEFETFRAGSIGRVTRAGIRSDHMQSADALRSARSGDLRAGWSHSDPDVLVAQGETAGLFRLSAEHVLPSLEGLREALERPGARFLDVGAGVGVISSELCMVYPEVSAECFEPNPEARRIGRERIRSAGLEERICFRAEGVEELTAAGLYDLAIIPQPFLSPRAFELGIERIRTALRPGGWMLVLALEVPATDPVAAAAARFRARLWGGGAVSAEELIAKLEGAGFEDARFDPPVGAYRMFAGRRSRVGAVPGAALEHAV